MGRSRKYTAEVLAPLVARSHSLAEVMRKLGLQPTGGNHRFISACVRRACLDTSHFVYGRRTRWLNAEMQQRIVELVPSSTSVAHLLQRLGMPDVGRPHSDLKKFLARQEIDTSHFTGRAWSRGHTAKTHPSVERVARAHRLPDAELFADNAKPVNGARLVRRLLELGWTYQCSCCGIAEWQGKPLVLHLDHINGSNNDNRLVNLRLLCPNCHSQTDTYCGRNRGLASRASDVYVVCYMQ